MEASICFKAYFILREEKRLTKSVWALLEPFALMCSVARMTLKHTYCGSKKRKLFKSLLFSGFDDVHFILLFVEHFSQIEYRKLVIHIERLFYLNLGTVLDYDRCEGGGK